MMWQTMFISIKRKVSSTLITTIILAILILVSYLAKHVVMYQQYHMADRLCAYLGELEEVITCTDMLQRVVVGG